MVLLIIKTVLYERQYLMREIELWKFQQNQSDNVMSLPLKPSSLQLRKYKMKVSQQFKNSKFAFNIDRGGTFTDFYVQEISNEAIIDEFAFKVLSESFYGEGPVFGIRSFLQKKGLMHFNQQIPTQYISHINLGTTIATNALLERKGCKNAMILTKGFGDLLKIRHQARPNIFDLKCEKKPPLAHYTLELNERIYLVNNEESDLKQQKVGKESIFTRQPSEHELQTMVEKLKQFGVESVGVSLCNSYLYSTHELMIKEYLEKAGFKFVEIGSNYHDLGYLKRSQTTSLDAFLNPIMNLYFNNLLVEFDKPEELTLRIMKSDGGFGKSSSVRASQLLLSGPAGGLIGCKSIINLFEDILTTQVNNLICLDMGGTSTDISRIEDKDFSIKYSLDVEGIQICTPHLEIDTIAAGGGSKLRFQNGMFVVGPESVGSNPGPACYGIGNQLALTDANLVLNRLDPIYFPKIFGKNKDESLNKEAAMRSFEILAKKVNGDLGQKSIYQIAQGYIEIANQLMAKSARKLLTLGIPDALVIFGSAGGQHCCDLAIKIGVKNVFIHKFSGILSAYGLSKAAETKENKFFLGIKTTKEGFDFEELEETVNRLKSKHDSASQAIYQVGIGYYGTSYTIKVPYSKQMIEQFEHLHKKQNGFSLGTSNFRIQYFTERIIKYPQQFTKIEQTYEEEEASKYELKKSEVFLEGTFTVVPYYDIQNMKNCIIYGPALLLSSTSSILVKKGWRAKVSSKITHLFFDSAEFSSVKTQETIQSIPDPIKLTLYSTRLMSIAEEMGKVLQKISISTNIRERLDFSCGIFDWEGKLLANAPHLPVHLGSMETAVTEQIKRGIQVGDVVLTNHPIAGGSHLPDLTVVSCTEIEGIKMYLASRGHHADIGGLTPGSMPAFSKSLSEEGVAVEQFHLIRDNEFQQKDLRQLFKQSRRIEDNVSDLLAQIAANEVGVKLLKKLIDQYGVFQFKVYVGFICENAAESVRNLLRKFSLENNLKEVDTVINTEYMDDGTPIKLALTINRQERNAVFNFEGTGFEVIGNTNAPRSITRSAILYCLRALIGEDIPLNSGCLRPLTIIIPDHTILSPSKQAAVVGGNVETSQKLVDLILKPFQYVACSQGTMNNFLFGNSHCCYYETICGGSGAGRDFNGTTVQCHMTNTRITDIEYLEKVYPVIVWQFNERKGSGGKGKHHGGDGVIREIQFTEEVTVSILSERRVYSAYGLKGGENGLVGRNVLIDRNGVQKSIGGKNTITVKKFQRVRIESPGGGGFGLATLQ